MGRWQSGHKPGQGKEPAINTHPSSGRKDEFFSRRHSEVAYDALARRAKASKIIAVVEDYLGPRLDNLGVLDVGCSTGIITHNLSMRFAHAIGIDIDEPAIQHARQCYSSPNTDFVVGHGERLPFPDSAFNVVICNHIYEHVSSAKALMAEILRALKPNGICYFAAGNRLQVMEPHYGLPFLSMLPRRLAHAYFKVSGRGDRYKERFLTLWGLRSLAREFRIIDYTRRVIHEPERFHATDMIKPGGPKHRLAKIAVKYAYCLCPTYIWLLTPRSRQDEND